jgi:hypothetical protein
MKLEDGRQKELQRVIEERGFFNADKIQAKCASVCSFES